MLVVVVAYLAAVTLLMAGYSLVWLLSPQLRAWMEAPAARLLEKERRFPRVVRERTPPAARMDHDNAIQDEEQDRAKEEARSLDEDLGGGTVPLRVVGHRGGRTARVDAAGRASGSG
jgi:hypothetical protein